MRRPLPGAHEAVLAGLAGQVDQLRADLDDLADLRTEVRAEVAAHSRALRDLARAIAAPERPATGEAAGGGASGSMGDEDVVPDWLTVTDPVLAIGWLTDLTVWVPRVWDHYPNARLPACWRWHPPVVTELLAVRYLWAEAMRPGYGVAAYAGWQDRWRPGTATRVRHAMSGCERAAGCHVNAAGQHYHYDTAVVDEYALWWATTADRTNPNTGTGPGVDLGAGVPGLTRETGPHHHDGHTAQPVPARTVTGRGVGMAGS
jgi:hypothetical protein